MENYLNTTLSPRERAADLLSRLSLEEKMAQVNCLFPYGQPDAYLEEEIKYGIGQVSTLKMRELKTLEQAVEWQRGYQEQIIRHSPHKIPGIFHMEGLCGAFLQDAVSLPAGINRGSAFDPELEQQLGAAVARQELALGITQILAPVLDISRDSRMGRQCETYGEDPALASALGVAFTRGVQTTEVDGRHAESCAKHFTGFHNSLGGIHGAECNTPEPMLKEIYAKPFQAAITESALRSVMPCYCTINGVPASSSKRLLTNLLREEMGFDGTCIADYSAVANVYQVQHVGETLEEAGLLCMEAGMDVELQNRVAFNDKLKEMFASGQADRNILDTAVMRVLEAKFRMGLFEHPYALSGEELQKMYHKEQDARLTLQAARESLILLKNDGTLPLRRPLRKIAVIGNHAAKARSFFGGYTHLSMVEATLAVANSIAGLEAGSMDGKQVRLIPGTQVQSDETEEFDAILKHQKPDCKSLLEELKGRLPEAEIVYAYGYPAAGNDLSHIPEAVEACRGADVILMTLGGKNGSCSVATMGEGVDSTFIGLPICQEACIRELSALGIPLIGIHLDGRPISSDIADGQLNAILEAFSPSEAGARAIVEVLTGDYNPGGKLPVSVSRSGAAIGVHYNHQNGSAWHQGASIGFANYVDLPHTPRYYFGHGLSYTAFSYSGLFVEQENIRPDEAVRVHFTLENTGDLAGDEVAQMYVTDERASVNRPVKELAGFRRVHLEPGERVRLQFEMKADQTAFVDRDGNWKVEKGRFLLEVGSSSEDIRLRTQFQVTEDQLIDPRTRGFYAKATIQ